jgi:hypothetical protein
MAGTSPAMTAASDSASTPTTLLLADEIGNVASFLTREKRKMAIKMPAADQAVLDRREAIVKALRAIVPGEGVIDSAAEMLPYESDGLMAYRQPPMVVVLPDTTNRCRKF